jgi:hypothetical protein
VVVAQGPKHGPIVRLVKDPVDDHVKTMVERIAGHTVDQPDVRTVGRVALLEYSRRRLSWPTRAIPRPCLARSSAAIELLPEPEFPRRTMSRVDSAPVLTRPR